MAVWVQKDCQCVSRWLSRSRDWLGGGAPYNCPPRTTNHWLRKRSNSKHVLSRMRITFVLSWSWKSVIQIIIRWGLYAHTHTHTHILYAEIYTYVHIPHTHTHMCTCIENKFIIGIGWHSYGSQKVPSSAICRLESQESQWSYQSHFKGLRPRKAYGVSASLKPKT